MNIRTLSALLVAVLIVIVGLHFAPHRGPVASTTRTTKMCVRAKAPKTSSCRTRTCPWWEEYKKDHPNWQTEKATHPPIHVVSRQQAEALRKAGVPTCTFLPNDQALYDHTGKFTRTVGEAYPERKN